jgi:hypothetical protein
MIPMLHDVMCLVINVLIPIALLIGWLVAEFRARPAVRIGLGLACLLFPCLWIWASLYTYQSVMDLNDSNLYRMERLLQDGRQMQVDRALQVYSETYQQTQSGKAAVFRMSAVLYELDAKAEKVNGDTPNVDADRK